MLNASRTVNEVRFMLGRLLVSFGSREPECTRCWARLTVFDAVCCNCAMNLDSIFGVADRRFPARPASVLYLSTSPANPLTKVYALLSDCPGGNYTFLYGKRSTDDRRKL